MLLIKPYYLFILISLISVLTLACEEERKLSLTEQSSIEKLIYTKHAKCRMECRHIDAEEIDEVIAQHKINYKKSNTNGHPCPTVAYEGQSHDGQNIRVIIADCDTEDKVVTVIDLNTEWECDCK